MSRRGDAPAALRLSGGRRPSGGHEGSPSHSRPVLVRPQGRVRGMLPERARRARPLVHGSAPRADRRPRERTLLRRLRRARAGSRPARGARRPSPSGRSGRLSGARSSIGWWRRGSCTASPSAGRSRLVYCLAALVMYAVILVMALLRAPRAVPAFGRGLEPLPGAVVRPPLPLPSVGGGRRSLPPPALPALRAPSRGL